MTCMESALFIYPFITGPEGPEILTAVVMENSVFWDMAPCSLFRVNLRFVRACGLKLQECITNPWSESASELYRPKDRRLSAK
jgi:hypothetical protein